MIVATFVEFDVTLGVDDYTFRFTYPSAEIEHDAIPSLMSVSVTPQVVDPGVSLGVRASARVSIRDFQYPLAGTAYDAGSFFGKIRARKRSLQGFPLRILRGEAGQALEDMITEHYLIESLARADETITITAKDALKLADGDRAQAPAVSTGRLLDDIDEAATTLTLTPLGIGDVEYPAAGKVALGGKEICTFTRVADVLTITRHESGTEASDHDADEIVQRVLEYSAESPADIIYDLLVTYTDILASWLPLSEWQADIDMYVARLYSAEIAEPTPVKDLINELIVQAGLVMWSDEQAQQIRLRSLRPMSSARYITVDEILADSFRYAEQPASRISEVWTYFAQRNPLESLDETKNFRSALITLSPDSGDYEQAAIRKVFSRWIALNNRPAASRLNDMLLSRYSDPPRKFSFTLFRSSPRPLLGQAVNLGHWTLQDEDGAEITALAQITQIDPQEDRYVCDAQELTFKDVVDDDGASTLERVVIIDSSVLDVNLRTLHDSFYSPAESGDVVTCVIEASAVIGSASNEGRSFDVGDWPAGVTRTLVISGGKIQGCGGNGGTISDDGGNGKPGGTAFYTRHAITIMSTGTIAGGGGGGGAYSFDPLAGFNAGGGGAGTLPGTGGVIPASAESGGTGVLGVGDGGGPAEAGSAGLGNAGGAAGVAVDGESFVTYSSLGTILGARIN